MEKYLDKLLHALASFALVVSLAALMRRWDAGIFLAILGTLAAGMLKELYDKKHGGEFDSGDMIADIIGTALGTLAAVLLLTA